MVPVTTPRLGSKIRRSSKQTSEIFVRIHAAATPVEQQGLVNNLSISPSFWFYIKALLLDTNETLIVRNSCDALDATQIPPNVFLADLSLHRGQWGRLSWAASLLLWANAFLCKQFQLQTLVLLTGSLIRWPKDQSAVRGLRRMCGR